jgi:DNA polymerase-3 subunit delta
MAKKQSTDAKITDYATFLLTGEDQYSIEIKTSEIVAEFLDSDLRDFNYSHFNEENFSPEQITSALYSLPVMAEKRVVLISDVDKAGADLLDALSRFLKKNVESTILILTGTKPDKRKSFFRDITSDKRTLSLEFKEKNEREIQQWIKNYIASKGFNITSEGLMLFTLSLSSNLSQIAAEADKLMEYCGGKTVTDDDVENVLGISKEYNIFKLQTAVVSKDLKKSYLICDNILKNKNNRTDPIAINLFLSRIFTSAFAIGYHAVVRKIPVDKAALDLGYNNPWKDADTIICAKNYKVTELIRCLRYFLECDIKLKSSYQDPATAVMIMLEKLIIHADDKDCQYLDWFGSLRRPVL